MRFPLRATPYVRLAKRLILGPGSLQSAAFHQDILHEKERVSVPPPIFLSGQLEKVIQQQPGVWGHKSKEAAIAEVVSTTITHAPTIAYHFRDAALIDGSIYIGRFKQPISDKSLFRSDARETCQIQSRALASSFLGTKYFGHWLADDCTRYLLAEQFGTPLCIRMPAYPHKRDYEKYFKQNWTSIDRAFIDRLVVFQDFSHNTFKRERYRALRARIKTVHRHKGRDTYVYLRRGATGAPRIILNEQEIMTALVTRGFVVADVGSDSLSDIVATLLNAKLVVSLEGSHVAHCTYTVPENGSLLILQPPNKFSAVHRDWSESLGIKFGFTVGNLADSRYQFSVSDILRTIDLLLKRS
jgi:hypothetical protein